MASSASFWISLTRLSIDTDTTAMLSAELPWRKAESNYRQAFPQNDARIVAVIDSHHPEHAARAVQSLLTYVAQHESLYGDSSAPFSGSFFEHNGLLYLSMDELEELALQLETAQPFLGRLGAEPSLAALFDLLQELIEHSSASQAVQSVTVLQRIARAIANAEHDTLSWQALIDTTDDKTSQPRLVLINTRSADTEREAVEKLRAYIGSDPALEQRVSLTGEAPLWVDQLDAARSGAVISAVLALSLGAAFLYLGLRSMRLVLASLVCLIAGLLLTAAFATLTVGRLNMISVAFATLYIGVAIDYGVQFCMRYQELRQRQISHAVALTETGAGLGRALTACAFTTVAAFYAFIPTDYVGVAELGWISGSGIFIGLMVSLTLLPAMIEVLAPHADKQTRFPVPAKLIEFVGLPARYRSQTRMITAILAMAAIPIAAQITFDYNPTHLNPQDSESRRAYERLSAGRQTSLAARVLALDEQAAARLEINLRQLDTVAEVISLQSWIPKQQTEKRELLQALQFSMAFPLSVKPISVDPERDLIAIQRFIDASNATTSDDALQAASDALRRELQTYRLASIKQLETLHHALLSELPGSIEQVNRLLQPQHVSEALLPPSLRAAWTNDLGQRRVEIIPREDLNDNDAMLRFTDSITALAPHATGAPVSFVGAARSVQTAFAQAFALAALLIVVLLLLLLRNLADTLRALVPLTLGSLILLAIMALSNIPLNFANIIALPLLLGIGVDIGVLVLWRTRHASNTRDNPVMSATGGAVLISVLATLGSFASLMLSEDGGMFSIGQLLSLGLLVHLTCTFLVMPAMLKR